MTVDPVDAKILWALLIGAQAVVNLPFLAHLLKGTKMALDFSKLQAAAADIGNDATALKTQADNSDDATNQAAIDAVTASLTTAHATLSGLIVTPPAPVTPPVAQ